MFLVAVKHNVSVTAITVIGMIVQAKLTKTWESVDRVIGVIGGCDRSCDRQTAAEGCCDRPLTDHVIDCDRDRVIGHVIVSRIGVQLRHCACSSSSIGSYAQ